MLPKKSKIREKKTPEHKHSVTFVTKVGTIINCFQVLLGKATGNDSKLLNF